MTWGYKPVVAIGEAQRKATTWGFVLITLVTEAKLPFDFVINDRGCTSLVRVRRLKYAQSVSYTHLTLPTNREV